MKLFIAFEGEYDDRVCVGVFSTEEKAKQYAAAYRDGTVHDIEEMELDSTEKYDGIRAEEKVAAAAFKEAHPHLFDDNGNYIRSTDGIGTNATSKATETLILSNEAQP